MIRVILTFMRMDENGANASNLMGMDFTTEAQLDLFLSAGIDNAAVVWMYDPHATIPIHPVPVGETARCPYCKQLFRAEKGRDPLHHHDEYCPNWPDDSA